MTLLVLVLLALLVVQGQSEASITGLVDNSTLSEWGLVTGTPSRFISESQYVFPGLRFRCNGNVTKWTVGLSFRGTRPRYPALGIFRDRPGGGGFADRVGATLLVNSVDIDSQVYEFTPDPPLPFQTNDSLGYYLPSSNELRLAPYFYTGVTGGPGSRSYVPSNPPAEGVLTFNFASDPTEETDLLPLVAVEIESDHPDSADCTRDFSSRDVLELLAPSLVRPSSQQIVFPSYNFTRDGNITCWTLAAQWLDEVGRCRFPELQIWRRRSGDTYDRIASTELTAAAESPNQLYSGTIDPPLQFQSGDLLGLFLPADNSNGARLLVMFGFEAGTTYETISTNAPLCFFSLSGQQTRNDRPYLSLEIRLDTQPTGASTTELETTATLSTGDTAATTTAPEPVSCPSCLSTPEAVGGMIGAFIGGVAVGVVTVLITVTAVSSRATKKNQHPKEKSVEAIDLTSTSQEKH